MSPQNNKQIHTIDISWNLIIKILITLGVIMLGARVLQVIVTIFFGFVIASSLMPIVNYLSSKKLPRILSVIFSYILVISVFLIIGTVIIKPIQSGFSEFVTSVPDLIDRTIDSGVDLINKLPFGEVDKNQVVKYVNDYYEKNLTAEGVMDSVGKTFSTLTSVGGFIGSLFMAFILSVYMLVDHDSFIDILLLRIIDDEQRVLVKELIEEVEQKLGRWMISQLSLMLIIGSLSWIVLLILGVKFSLPLAAIAGLLTVIPSIGPLVSMIPAVVVAIVFKGFGWGLAVAIGYILIQQIDNTFITPRIMGNLAGTKPVIVVIGVMVGFSVAGVLGAIMTIPILVLLKILYDFFVKLKRLKVIGSK